MNQDEDDSDEDDMHITSQNIIFAPLRVMYESMSDEDN